MTDPIKGQPLKIGSDNSKPNLCSICLSDLAVDYGMDFARNYPGLVCRSCDQKALNVRNQPAEHSSWEDSGDNPVFITKIKCWRRYKFGGFVTMRDPHNCTSIEDFYHTIEKL